MNRKLILFLALTFGGFWGLWFFEDFLFSALFNELDSGLSGAMYSICQGLAEKIQILGKEYVYALLLQIKFRWVALCLFGFYMFSFSGNAHSNIISEKKLLWLMRLFFVVLLIYLPDLSKELQLRNQWQSFYEGLTAWRWLIPSYPGTYVIQMVVFLLFAIGAVLVVAKLEAGSIWLIPGLSALLIGWTYLLILFFGFGKIDHTYASMYTGLWGMLACVILINQNPDWSEFGFRIFQATIWGCYFFSGLEKLFLSGFDWIDPAHFQALNFLHPTDAGNWIVSQPALSGLILAGALGFQLLSPLQWRWQKWGYVNVACGLAFHLGTWFLFGIGGWQSPWIVMLVFLWPVGSIHLSNKEK